MNEPDRSAVQILLQARAREIDVWADGDRLRFSAPAGAMDEVLRERLSRHKHEILAFLAEADGVDYVTRYIPMPDGAQLAADIFRPKRDGQVIREPLPVIWGHERYHRAHTTRGLLTTDLDTRPWLRGILRHGYVIAVVDARGSGASTGVRRDEISAQDAADGHHVTRWLAAQPWCDGNVGMYGNSYLAIAQFLAASTAPPELRAIVPQVPLFDLYAFLYSGGVFRDDFAAHWGQDVRALDTGPGAAPVAGHAGRLTDARQEHRANTDVFTRAAGLPFRDSRDPRSGTMPYRDHCPSGLLDRVNAAGIPTYVLTGWYDIWVRDAILWFAGLRCPRKLVIGPWSHTTRDGIDLVAQHVRWYDHWLKGLENGVLAEPPVRYYTMNARPGDQWRSCWQWPPPRLQPQQFYLHAGPTGSVSSVNDGALHRHQPTGRSGLDEYTADYSTSSGRSSRWTNGYGGPFGYRLDDNDRKALTYTTRPLPEDLEITGHPIAHLYVTSSHPDGDFFAYLEDVDGYGTTHYVTEGVLRASHRGLAPAPYDNLGLPYHPGTRASQRELTTEPAELTFDLYPTSYLFRRGHRIRVCVTCCDRDNAATIVHQPPPVVRIHRSARFASFVVLPVMPRLATTAWGRPR